MDGLPDNMRHVMDGLPDNMRHGRRAYCPLAAAFLADCAAAAYARRPFQAVAEFTDFDFLRTFSCGGTQGYIADFGNGIVVAFRGTERDYRDILTDMDFWPDPVGDMGGTVHGGFLAAYKGVAPVIKAILRDLPRKPIYLTGHSLGGALAVLAAADLAGPLNVPGRRIEVYTYGAPRVGDRAFLRGMRDFTHADVYRHTNTADIVPWVPPFALRYRHGGAHIHLTDDGRVLKAPGLWRHLRSMVMALIPGLLRARHWTCMLPLRLFTDHRIDAYRRKLRARANG